MYCGKIIEDVSCGDNRSWDQGKIINDSRTYSRMVGNSGWGLLVVYNNNRVIDVLTRSVNITGSVKRASSES